MELEWLQDFVSLAKTGSFTQASEHRNISQSAFSRRIRALENWIGAELVDRHTHPVVLTEAGAQLVATANQIIRTMHKTRDDYGYRQLDRLSPLPIGVADHLAIHFAPSWLKIIEPVVGNRKIKLVTGLRAGLGFVDLLVQQQLDFLLAFGGSVVEENGGSGHFESMILGQDQLLPVCLAELAGKTEYAVPFSRQDPLPHISYMPGSALSNLINRVSTRRKRPIHLKTVVETGSAEAIKSLVLNGFGMAWLPRMAMTEELKSGVLAEIGEKRYRIPFTIELFRYTANTKREVVLAWCKIKKISENVMH
jgi:LysR family transcriptional regulator, hypochlorite-specific transcription factor HypT